MHKCATDPVASAGRWAALPCVTVTGRLKGEWCNPLAPVASIRSAIPPYESVNWSRHQRYNADAPSNSARVHLKEKSCRAKVLPMVCRGVCQKDRREL